MTTQDEPTCAAPAFPVERVVRLGRRQREILEAVRAEARAWLDDDDIAPLAADASVTTLRLYGRLAGSTADEIHRSACALVSRGLLRRVKVGWALSATEYAKVSAKPNVEIEPHLPARRIDEH